MRTSVPRPSRDALICCDNGLSYRVLTYHKDALCDVSGSSDHRLGQVYQGLMHRLQELFLLSVQSTRMMDHCESTTWLEDLRSS